MTNRYEHIFVATLGSAGVLFSTAFGKFRLVGLLGIILTIFLVDFYAAQDREALRRLRARRRRA
jgi:hypothetical protein